MCYRVLLSCRVAMCFAVGLVKSQPIEQGLVYRGQFQAAGEVFAGTANLRFRLYDAIESGNQIGLWANRDGLLIANGVFSVTLDFGFNAFDGSERFLKSEARASGDAGFTPLAPRQRLAPTPIAIASRKPWAISWDNTFFSGGNVGVGEVNPLTPLHLTNGSLFLDLPALFQDDLLIEDSDAILGLPSDSGGAAGSGIVLKEINPGGTLFDTWGIYRSTSGAQSELRMT